MPPTILAMAVAYALNLGASSVQSAATTTVSDHIQATVRIPQAVLVGGGSLPAGTYEIRITTERPAPLPGQPSDAQRRVELIAGGKVVAREVAEVLRDEDLPSVGASSRPVRSGTRVDILKGGEFLRVSIKHEHERFLVHLPIERAETRDDNR